MNQPLVNIGEVIVNGTLFDPKNWARPHSIDPTELYSSVSRLFDLLEERQIDFALVGDIAMLSYVNGRNTQVIDLILARDDLARLPEIMIEQDERDFAHTWLGGLRVDLLFTNNELVQNVHREYVVKQEFADRQIPCASVEGLLLLKLFALPSLYQQRRFDRVTTDEKDIADLIERYSPSLQPMLAELTKHMLPTDIAELHKIVDEIQAHIAKSRDRFSGGDER